MNTAAIQHPHRKTTAELLRLIDNVETASDNHHAKALFNARQQHLNALQRAAPIEAQAATRQRQRRQKQQQRLPVYIGFDLASGPDQTTTHHWRPPQHKSAPAQDLKRAAAGDRDD